MTELTFRRARGLRDVHQDVDVWARLMPSARFYVRYDKIETAGRYIIWERSGISCDLVNNESYCHYATKTITVSIRRKRPSLHETGPLL